MHQRREAQSLAMHREIAARVREDPSLLYVPKRNLARWQARQGRGPLGAAYSEWEHILATLDLESLLTLITREDEEARRLRQSSPFAGILTPREVWEIKKKAGVPHAS